jgi:hypothetical protein
LMEPSEARECECVDGELADGLVRSRIGLVVQDVHGKA